MFTIVAPAGANADSTPNRLRSQFMLCVNGAVDVVCDEDRNTLLPLIKTRALVGAANSQNMK